MLSRFFVIMRTTLLAAGIAFAVTGCSSVPNQYVPDTGDFKITDIQIGNDGVGGIGVETSFDKGAVMQALPGLSVELATHSTEGESFPALLVTDAGQLLATYSKRGG